LSNPYDKLAILSVGAVLVIKFLGHKANKVAIYHNVKVLPHTPTHHLTDISYIHYIKKPMKREGHGKTRMPSQACIREILLINS